MFNLKIKVGVIKTLLFAVSLYLFFTPFLKLLETRDVASIMNLKDMAWIIIATMYFVYFVFSECEEELANPFKHPDVLHETLSKELGDKLHFLTDEDAKKEMSSLKSKLDLLSEESIVSDLDLDKVLDYHRIIEYLKILDKYDLDSKVVSNNQKMVRLTVRTLANFKDELGLDLNDISDKYVTLLDYDNLDLEVPYSTFVKMYQSHLGIQLTLNKNHNNHLNEVFGIEDDNISKFITDNLHSYLDDVLQLYCLKQENNEIEQNNDVIKIKNILSQEG